MKGDKFRQNGKTVILHKEEMEIDIATVKFIQRVSNLESPY